MPKPKLPRPVIWFGVVSFLTDASSELIYPLLPRFLTVVLGAGAGFVGAVEGVAEATASLLKLVSGRLADAAPRKKPLTVIGYGISSLVRPLVALATAPWMVLGVRFLDRVGKGIRSSPRDAILAEVTPKEQRGAAYGYHRAMDNAGAVVGPLLAWILLARLELPLRTIFALAAIPGGLALLALIFGVKESPRPVVSTVVVGGGPSPATEPGDAAGLRRYLTAVGLFTLANASDAFLLLRASECGVADAHVPLLWLVHNAVKALLSKRFGALSDRLGRRRLIGAGWIAYAGIYLAFGVATAAWQLWTLFALYGLYYALVEGSERALVADLAGSGKKGTAFGWFHLIVGLGALPASLGFGLLYRAYGAPSAFTLAAALALLATVALAWSAPRGGAEGEKGSRP